MQVGRDGFGLKLSRGAVDDLAIYSALPQGLADPWQEPFSILRLILRMLDLI
jgi:hypothetical protein